MKKKLLLLFMIILSLPLLLWSNEVSVEKAQKIANMVVPGVFYQTSTDYYYVFGKDNGWVLISSNDVIEPLIAYSEEGSFNIDNIPPAFEWILEGVKEEMKARIKKNVSPSLDISQQWSNETFNELKNSQEVTPLLSTAWDQLEPYNRQCPLFNGNPSYTGCVATAMAQIINYYKYPARGIKNIPSYSSAGMILIPEITTEEMVYSWETGEKNRQLKSKKMKLQN